MNYEFKTKIPDCSSWLTAGTVNISGTNVALNEYPLYSFMKQFVGQFVEIAVIPRDKGIKIDSKIVGLVEILNKLNYDTISSCEGHISPNNKIVKPFPWIAFRKLEFLQYGYYLPPENSGWMLDYFKEDDPELSIPIWRTKLSAKNENELCEIQDKYINGLAKLLLLSKSA